jgi:hypothetical protein
MTIAEKAALAEKQKMEHYLKQQNQTRMQAAAWDGLDSLAVSGRNSASGVGRQAKDDDWALGMTASSSTPANPVSQPSQDDDWGLGDFASVPSTTAPSLPVSSSQSI